MARAALALCAALLAAGTTTAAETRPALARRGRPPPRDTAIEPRASSAPPGVGIGETIVQIVNNVAGAGILTLSAGMSGGVGWVPATLLCLLMGAISGYTFYIVGVACEKTGETTFKGLWSRALGSSSSWLVDASISLMCLSAAIIYSGIMGDVSTQLLSLTRLPKQLNSRGANILAISACVLLPLSLMEDLSALSFTSSLGCLAIFYTAGFIAWRALDGSYALSAIKPGDGRLLSSIAAGLEPSFKLASRWKLDASALVLCSNLGLAYIAHYNAPAFYRALERRSTKRFATAVSYAFLILSLLYTGIMLLGYSTFGDNSSANLLKNYGQADTLALLGRVATFLSLLFGFPLAMLGLRDSSRSLLEGVEGNLALLDGVRSAARAARHSPRALTVAFLSAIALIAILLTDIGAVVGVSGALLGASIVYIYPAVIYSRVMHLHALSAVHALVPLGAVLGILGVWQTLK